MTADLAAWLLAPDGPIAEDERLARATRDGDDVDAWQDSWHTHRCGWSTGEGFDDECVCDVPARVLAECAAKRQIIGEYRLLAAAADARYLSGTKRSDPASGSQVVAMMHGVVRALAQPYRGRPGWRDEWATT